MEGKVANLSKLTRRALKMLRLGGGAGAGKMVS